LDHPLNHSSCSSCSKIFPRLNRRWWVSLQKSKSCQLYWVRLMLFNSSIEQWSSLLIVDPFWFFLISSFYSSDLIPIDFLLVSYWASMNHFFVQDLTGGDESPLQCLWVADSNSLNICSSILILPWTWSSKIWFSSSRFSTFLGFEFQIQPDSFFNFSRFFLHFFVCFWMTPKIAVSMSLVPS
jgi:hypothetical protein